MPLLMKHTGPLWGIWKIEESSEVLLSLLRNREEYLPQLELIRTEQRRREWLACRVLLQELTGRGWGDIDDVTMSLLGVLIGVILFYLLNGLSQSVSNREYMMSRNQTSNYFS